jgi:hypothetical protein
MTRDAWLASGHADVVAVDFPDACRPYFGLP